MPRTQNKTVFTCDSCGSDFPKWEGRCPTCSEWNTLVEIRGEWTGRRPGISRLDDTTRLAEELSQISTEILPRMQASSTEVNRVWGGGIVPGSLTLLAGDPGIGKSTLLLRLSADVCANMGTVLYVSGEESPSQVKMRADRLGVSGKNLYLLPSTNLVEILRQLDERRPKLAVVDSIQTTYNDSVSSEAGSVAQIRECTRRLTEWAKCNDVPIILSGHMTKGGDIAGPRVLEHMVDVVLHMEGESVSSWRLLRTIKNRFGSTNEVGVFEMTTEGLVDVEDPSKAFLSERKGVTVGSVITSTMEGSRPLLVEIQALTTPSALSQPRRIATGVDFNRLILICAILTRRAGMTLSNQDVVVNIPGGLRVAEPAADLGMALATASSIRDIPLGEGTAAIGEVGLNGEVRQVPQLSRRVQEVGRLGLKRCFIPDGSGSAGDLPGDLEIIPVHSLYEAIENCMSRQSPRTSHMTRFS